MEAIVPGHGICLVHVDIAGYDPSILLKTGVEVLMTRVVKSVHWPSRSLPPGCRSTNRNFLMVESSWDLVDLKL